MTERLHRFSIIVPTYGRAQPLDRCLSSLAALDFPRDQFEVVVVDDGSPICPRTAVRQHEGAILVRTIRKSNGGPASARNAGADVARGQFLAFTDDDCQPAVDWLSKLDARLKQHPERMVGGKTVNSLPCNIYSTTSQLIVDAVCRFQNSCGDDARFFASNNMVVSAELFHRLGGFDTSFPRAAAEDRDFCDRWRHGGRRLTYAPEAVVHHAHHLTLRSFLRQHFNYGRGARRYHKLRAMRGSGRMGSDTAMHFQMPALLREPMAELAPLQRSRVGALLLVWEAANAAGFLCEEFFGTSRSTGRRGQDNGAADSTKGSSTAEAAQA